MRILTFIFSLSLTAAPVFAQGTVNFANVAVGLNAPFFDGDGTPLGSQFLAQLYVGSDANESSLAAVPGPTPFLDNTGFFTGGTKTLPGFAPGAKPFFQVRFWEATGGNSYEAAVAAGAKAGKTTIFQIPGPLGNPTAEPPTPPATLLGLGSNLPEPSAIALGILGGVALLLRRRKRGRRPIT